MSKKNRKKSSGSAKKSGGVKKSDKSVENGKSLGKIGEGAKKSGEKKNTLTIENLSYSYRNGEREQKVLDDINAEFEAGRM